MKKLMALLWHLDPKLVLAIGQDRGIMKGDGCFRWAQAGHQF
jgi:hypothetical protein